ncbi:mitochondrial 54S ribosomal protein YmL35 [Tieghemiomyces parasiticus]|uniref:Mitochondrial 54S ribosomal protein YmL35 n=1 Tax=Tieghemiomyces parasiticus TaxID=78921 RepID=A0A9W8DNB8_9FUNG|nr:mitochondrial 54S ribosomal protein YmL35 [Tieghemiomyces parasiticus]
MSRNLRTIQLLRARLAAASTLRPGLRVGHSAAPVRAFTLGATRYQASEVAYPKYQTPSRGVNPAYDAALDYLDQHKAKYMAQAKEVAEEIEALRQDKKAADAETRAAELEKEHYRLRVEAELYDSEVLWNFKQGNVDLTVPVYHYLTQRQFANEYLPILEQRITQMFVVPDLLPPSSVHPEFKLEAIYPSSSEATEATPFTVGVILQPTNTVPTPKVVATPFHTDQRLYTLVMVDPDSPNQETHSYDQRCHWLLTNVSLSVTQPAVNDTAASGAETILDYIPPHPARGTKRHRYVFFLLEQPNGGRDRLDAAALRTTATTDGDRQFDMAAFVKQNNLVPRAVTFFRAEYDDAVRGVYEDILKRPNPDYQTYPYIDPRVGPDGRKIDIYRYY